MAFYDAGDIMQQVNTVSGPAVRRYNEHGVFVEDIVCDTFGHSFAFDVAVSPSGNIYLLLQNYGGLNFRNFARIDKDTRAVSIVMPVAWDFSVYGGINSFVLDGSDNIYAYAVQPGVTPPHVVKIDPTGSIVYDKTLNGPDASAGIVLDGDILGYGGLDGSNIRECIRQYNLATDTDLGILFSLPDPPGWTDPLPYLFGIQSIAQLPSGALVASCENDQSRGDVYDTTVGVSTDGTWYQSGRTPSLDGGQDVARQVDGTIYFLSVQIVAIYRFTQAGVLQETITTTQQRFFDLAVPLFPGLQRKAEGQTHFWFRTDFP